MNEPRRLIQSGGIAQRLLDSASLDKPGPAARRHAASLAATASSFSRTSSSGGSGTYRARGSSGRSAHPARTLATWITVGVAASVALGVVGSRLLNQGGASHAAAPLDALPTLTPTKSPEIAAEPAAPLQPAPELAAAPSLSAIASAPAEPAPIEPWVPSPVPSTPGAAPTTAAPQQHPNAAAASDEARQIEAARAALSHGDCPRALVLLDAYDSTHPNGQLKPEAMALRIQALTNMGKTTEARTLASEFAQKYPQHPLVGRVSGGLGR